MKRCAGVLGIALTSAWGLLFACVGSDPDPVVASEGGADALAANDTGSSLPAGNVLKHSDFEETACLGWESNQVVLTQDNFAHGGKASCRVCIQNGITSVWSVFQNGPPLEAGAYIVTAYAHAADAGGPQHVNITAQRLDDAGQPATEQQQQILAVGVSDPTWQMASFEFPVQFNGESIAVGAEVSADTLQGCFLLDDFTVVPKASP